MNKNTSQTNFHENKIRPRTSKYRNQSQIVFGQQLAINNKLEENGRQILRKRPQSYKNFSRVAQFMKDSGKTTNVIEKVCYKNIIQNTYKSYEIPKNFTKFNEKQQHKFQEFFEKNENKMYKTTDQFSQYTDLMNKNSILLRRGQFNVPLRKQQFSQFKRSHTDTGTSFINTRYYNSFKPSKTANKFNNTISQNFQKTLKQKKSIQKQKDSFFYQRRKNTKPLNKTFMGHVTQYQQLWQKERSNQDKTPLNNAMNRMLTMELMGKQIQNMTHMYI